MERVESGWSSVDPSFLCSSSLLVRIPVGLTGFDGELPWCSRV